MPACDTAIALHPPLPAASGALAPVGRRQFVVEWARSPEDVREAQRLRYRVFSHEMGARLVAPPGSPPGLDMDHFDPFCEHLLVRAMDRGPGERGAVIGTYRVLSPTQARKAGGYYSDAEFDLGPIESLRPRAVELGRSCVHVDWRQGSVIMSMWRALGEYMLRHDLDTMIGCASISLADGTLPAMALCERLRSTHQAPAQWRVSPRRALTSASREELAALQAGAQVFPDAPPLIKGYLRCGARVLGAPALDEAFNTADLPLMLRLQDVAPRYRKHFLESG